MFKEGDKVEVYRRQHNVLYFPIVNKGFKGTIDYVVYDEQVPTNYARITSYNGPYIVTTYVKLSHLKKVK